MGNTLSRQRSRILIRLYHNGTANREMCIHELFQGCSDMITLVDIQKTLSMGSAMDEWMNVLYSSCDSMPPEFQVSDVVHFLATGEIPNAWKYTYVSTNNSATEEGFHMKSRDRMDLGKNLILHKKTESTKQLASPSPKRSILKRHETIISERIVRTVTFEDGIRTETIETDKTQSDKIRMETDKEEFAIREFTQQEQTEEENGTMVTFIRATEEFVHLKSKEDEFEYLHSDIPTNGSEDEYCSSNGSTSSEDQYI